MSITAKMVQDLRKQSGAGIMECKEALKESEGDIEKSLDFLRKKGSMKAAKKADRSTKEGSVAIAVDGKSAAMVEIKCETDFVARNEVFQTFCADMAKHVVNNDMAEDESAFGAQTFTGGDKSVKEVITERIHEIGENIVIGRKAKYEIAGNGGFGNYVHGTGNIGVLVEFSCEKEETETDAKFLELTKDIAMHIAATAPSALNAEDIPADLLAKEKDIFETQAKESGKPEKIIPKIIEGRVQKFYAESCLLLQSFVKDPDITVIALLKKVSEDLGDTITISRFNRFQLGE